MLIDKVGSLPGAAQDRTFACYGDLVVPTPHNAPFLGEGAPPRDARSLPFCASHELITVIGDRWSVLVLCQLGDHGQMRSAALRRAVEGVSQKVLTSCLRRLEDHGFVNRTVEATVPVTVCYQLTPFGKSFFQVFQTLRQWADEHVDQITSAAGRDHDVGAR